MIALISSGERCFLTSDQAISTCRAGCLKSRSVLKRLRNSTSIERVDLHCATNAQSLRCLCGDNFFRGTTISTELSCRSRWRKGLAKSPKGIISCRIHHRRAAKPTSMTGPRIRRRICGAFHLQQRRSPKAPNASHDFWCRPKFLPLRSTFAPVLPCLGPLSAAIKRRGRRLPGAGGKLFIPSPRYPHHQAHRHHATSRASASPEPLTATTSDRRASS